MSSDSAKAASEASLASAKFDKFLEINDPSHTWQVHHIATGANVTARATHAWYKDKQGDTAKQSQDQNTADPCRCAFPGDQTIILKYCPPYVASSRGAKPLSTHRLRVEAKALSLFGIGGTFEALADGTLTMVPELLRLAIPDHILVMQDVGRKLTLASLLRLSIDSRYYRRKVREVFKEMGKSIGEFFGHLHAPSTMSRLEDHNLSEFQKDGAKDPIFSLKILHMKKYLDDVKVEVEDGEIYDIIEHEFSDEEKLVQTPVFALGNLSPDNILVSLDKHEVGVIGWQHSGPGCGLNGDIAQFVAHIQAHVMLVNNVKRVKADDRFGPLKVGDDGNELPVEVDKLLSYFSTLYRRSSRIYLASWSVAWDEDVRQNDWRDLNLPAETASILRSAFIAFGTELISIAMSQSGGCSSERELKETARMREKWVKKGCWHIRMTGNGTDVFKENWEEICDRGSPLLPFVLGD